MSTVYVVQDQMRLDRAQNILVPKYPSLKTEATKFGNVQYLLSPSAAPWAPESVIRDLKIGLREYKDDDYLVLIGNPFLIGLAVAVAADFNDGKVTALQWSGKEKSYVPVRAQVFPAEESDKVPK